MTESVLAGLTWRCIGPHRGGRVVAVAGDVADPMTFYFGACAGGVWKTTDGGNTWRCVSDGFLTTAAVGAVAVSRSDSNVVWAGTGETTIRGNVSHGDGVYRSLDGGKTWANMGLRDTRHVGRIVIHPRNPDVVYVAALGHAWGPNQERGIYRTRDGGATWEHVLAKSERAGSHDVAMDPTNPRVLYAAVWQAQRFPHALENGGPDSGLWRSTDGGDTWQEITANLGLRGRPKHPRTGEEPASLGKIGVAVSPEPVGGNGWGRVWALVEAADGALFRSDDGGETWARVNEESKLRTRPWYYMHVTADPRDAETVYVQNYQLWRSVDGGRTLQQMTTPHGDEHALWIDPNNPRRIIAGDDGGARVSFNGGASWSSIYNQPTAQLYHVTTDDAFPYRVFASQQDNTAIALPSRSVEGAILPRDWEEPGGGESGYISVKPDDRDIVVASGPIGRRAYNDIMTVWDRRTGQRRNITVWPELYGWGAGAESLKYRLQWTFPILFSRHDPNVLWVAGNRLFRSTDLGASWEVLSEDLTRNDPAKLGPSGGPITRDNTGAEVYCTIFALAESPQRAGRLWAGSDDGLVHRSDDGGRTWERITPPDLPEWALISVLEPSPHDADTLYVAATRYKHDDTLPYLYKTADAGRTWTDVTGDLPADDFTRTIREDPASRGLLYCGTETGISVSFDDGARWHRLSGNLPVVPIHDLIVKGDEMVVATHGRSIWILDDLTPLREMAHASTQHSALSTQHLFAPPPTVRFRTYKGFGGPGTPSVVNFGRSSTNVFQVLPLTRPDGSTEEVYLDAGQNPPNGVVVQYYLPERPAGEVTLTFLDAAGRELRTYRGAGDGVRAEPGLNRFVWNRRVPGATGVEHEELAWWDRPDGPMVLPGRYAVRLTVGGETQTREFDLLADPRIQTSRADLEAQFAMLGEIVGRLSDVNATLNRVDGVLRQVDAWTARAGDGEAGGAVRAAAEPLRAALLAVRPRLIDVNMKQAQLWPSGLHEKFNALFDSVDCSDHAPPQQAREVFAELSSQLDDLKARVARTVAERAPGLNAAVERAGLAPVRWEVTA